MSDTLARAWQRGFDAGWDARGESSPYRTNPYSEEPHRVECCASGRCEVCSPGYDWGRDG